MARTPTSQTLQSEPTALPPGYQITAPGDQVLVPVLAFWAILLPAGLAIQLGDVTIPPYRFVLMALAPFALMEFGRRQLRLAWTDYLIIAGSLWVPLAYFMNTGIDKAVQGGGSFVIDTLGSYFIGRAYITDVRRLRTFLIRALPGVILIAAIMAFEAFSHKLLIAELFPTRARYEKLYEVRLGLLRARASFPHSIAAGTFMASFLSLYLLSGIPRPSRWSGTLAACTAIFSGSSAAILGLALTAFLIAYRAFFTFILRTREKMIYLLYAFVVMFGLLELITQRGAVRAIIRNFTLDSRTAYYRLLIWDYGTASVKNDPVFGIGDAPMPRASWMVAETIDNHWLLLAVKYGLPTAIATFVAVVGIIWTCGQNNKRLNNFDRSTTNGLLFAVTSAAIIGWSVAFWVNYQAWFMLLLGISAALVDQVPNAYRALQRANQQPRALSVKPI